MILYDYECKLCGHIFEKLSTENSIVYCEMCEGYTKRLISAPGGTNANQDADWIRSVCEVVDKNGGAHCQEFLKRPTRDNLNKWMKKEGIRHFEQGEPIRHAPVNTRGIEREVLEKARKRDRIEI